MNRSESIIYGKYVDLGYDVIRAGIPDLMLLKDGRIEFVEVKTENNPHLNENQKSTIKLLEKHGIPVRVEVVENPPNWKNSRSLYSFPIRYHHHRAGSRLRDPVFPSWIFDEEDY